MKDKNEYLNEVIRVKKRPSNFVLIDKSFLEDDRLSFKAKGILAYLLSRPDDWKVIVGDLIKQSTDGKASVYAGLKELKECGYYEKVPVRNVQGTRIVRWESTVYEVPRSLLSDFQEVENQEIENLFIENRERNNNYNTNNYNTNNYSTLSEKRDETSEFDTTVKNFKTLIGYDDLILAHKEDVNLINEFVSIGVDAIMSKTDYFVIQGVKKPKALVVRNLMLLTYEHIEHVLWTFKDYDKEIKKERKFILALMYNATMEMNCHYSNDIKSNWGY